MKLFFREAVDPYEEFLAFRSKWDSDESAVLLLSFSYQQYWLEDKPVELLAIYWFTAAAIRYGVVEKNAAELGNLQENTELSDAVFSEWLEKHDISLFTLNESLPLQTVSIAKPWGQEIWYTGVEARGVACFGSIERRVPIPYLLAVMPSVLGAVEQRELVLLKILDPLPEEVFGDLYFELHREKQEVYVVTNIDQRAWPEGVGQMRMGFSPSKIAEAVDDGEFRQAFLKQVLAYREIRVRIDGLLDEKRQQEGYALNAEVPVEQLKRWLAEIPTELTREEKKLRQQMESFFGKLPLKPGDVVKVPLRVPHSLQHGVRTIEFQTPVYERRILCFAQKVLTQDHWDTEPGVEEMEIAEPSLPELKMISEQDGVCVEQVVEFSDFEVERVGLSDGQSYRLESDVYQLLIAIEGVLIVGEQQVAPEQALLLPAGSPGHIAQPLDNSKVTFLVATPKN